MPPINPTLQAVLVGGQGTVAVPVANTVADTVELIGGVLLMNGQQGSGGDASGSHDEAPQAPMDEKDTEAKRKVSGNSSNKVGKEFENLLIEELGGIGEFEVTSEKYSCTRQFDGAYGNVYYEAKAGGFWAGLEKSSSALNEFQSKTIQKLKIANDLGKTFEIHTNSPIPQDIKDWFIKKGISFHEWL